MRHFVKLFGLLVFTLIAILISIAPLEAQEAPPSPPPQNPGDNPPKRAGTGVPGLPTDTSNPDDDANVPPPPPGPPNPYAGAIKDAGTGLPIFGTPGSPLRWGDFSISSVQYVAIHDKFDPQGLPEQPWTNLQIFQVGLMFNHLIKKTKSRIILQYLPQMAIIDGEFHANAAANNNVSLGTRFDLSSRLSVTVQGSFMDVHSDPLIPENFLAADGREGALVQNNFLDTNGSFWAATADATIQYNFSARTTLTFAPIYRYAQATNNGANYLADGQTIAGLVTLGHALTPHRTIGVTESYQYLTESNQSARYETIGGFYSEQLTRSLWVTGNLGAQRQSFSDLPNGNNWGYSGGFSLIENVTRKVPIALAYTRGVALSNNNYITLQKSDRIDASIGILILPRVSWNNSAGYLRELGGNPSTQAKYGTTEVDYRFYGNFTMFSTFAYTVTNTSSQQLFSGERRTLAFGIRWRPPMLFAQ
jgi:hypothetical protein